MSSYIEKLAAMDECELEEWLKERLLTIDENTIKPGLHAMRHCQTLLALVGYLKRKQTETGRERE